jgi:hypothetical protein
MNTTNYPATRSQEDNRIMAEVAHYCFGAIRWMNVRLDLVTEGQCRTY